LPPPLPRGNETVDDLLDSFIAEANRSHSGYQSADWDLKGEELPLNADELVVEPSAEEKAAAAQDDGVFDNEIIPVELPQGKGEEPARFSQDECVRRDTTLAKLAKLKPVFKAEGTVTAGNASPLNDGASALLITSLQKAHNLGLEPMARIVAWGHAGVHPGVMGIGPVPASRKALRRAGIDVKDIDVAELNEAFAAQTVASVRALGLDPAKVNRAGGAIALGHPLGCSGARIVTTLAHGLQQSRGRYGLATMCIGVGQGIACVLERT